MPSTTRHRHATRWPRRIVFALAILLVLALLGRLYWAWQAAQPHAPEPVGQVV